MSNKKSKAQNKEKKSTANSLKATNGKITIKQANPFAGMGKIWFFCALFLIAITLAVKITGNILRITNSDIFTYMAAFSGVCMLLSPPACLTIEIYGIRDCICDMRYGGDGKFLIPLILELVVTIPWLVYAAIVIASIVQVAVE